MAKYRVLTPSYIDGKLIDKQMLDNAGDAGVIIDYDGIASDNLQLVPGPGRKTKESIDKEQKEALAVEAMDAKAVRLDAAGKPTAVPIDGTESLEEIQAAFAVMKQGKTL